MEFWKMNGAGNDFIIINNIVEKISPDRLGSLAKKLCDRRMSLGADGFMAVDSASGDGDYKMLFYNSDGSMGEMCGNGARCICRYGFETGLAGPLQRVETTAGMVVGERISERLYKTRLNLPTVCRIDEKIPADALKTDALKTDGLTCLTGIDTITCSYMELGNPGIPHCIVHIKGLKDCPQEQLLDLARMLRWYDGYPKGANVNFYDIIDENHVFERTFERGVEDFTYACGTGTGSVAAVLALKGLISGKNTIVDMRGGRLVADITLCQDHVTEIYLTGPTNIVAKGTIFDEDLNILTI